MYDAFIIHLEGLKSGQHSFKFLLDKTFFESIEYSIIKEGKVEIDLLLDKKERLTELHSTFVGKVNIECDRCGEYFDLPLDFDEETVVKYGEESFIDEGIWMIEPHTKELDLKHFFYESVCLAIPSKVTHDLSEDSDCPEETLKQLSAYSIDNNTQNTDPRWDALNKLK